ncbi:uncharacterized protein BX663DRAFT_425573 [Cokeromyces recurvatus]|uniref:uncharacterized protein n=1 Tax=Cokeromyces recurvatus TaxID=90255 RepID=UPI00221F21D7|nr:uncharacterized protein BX663DRAFT_425573 [Cokeromyces recurvatus]KAI7907947.1 hypothetical protein BX663DRAFT_425573 [Cokeromyces recurvatus]
MRFNAIQDILQLYRKRSDNVNHRITHQLREITCIIQHTFLQVYDIFISKENKPIKTLLESYVESFQKTFLIPSKSSHGNETPSQPAVTRLFSPSSSVHLIVRYLPETIQTYTPQFNPEPLLQLKDVQTSIKAWIQNVESFLKEKLSELFLSIQSQSELVQIRCKLWKLLEDNESNIKNNKWETSIQHLFQDDSYSIWGNIYRDIFNNQAKCIIDRDLEALSCQPETHVWPHCVTDPKKNIPLTIHIWPNSNGKHQSAFTLPNLSSSKEIEKFKTTLKETALDKTDALSYLQECFDSTLARIREDIQSHFNYYDNDQFYAKYDIEMIKTYFQDKCYESVINYSNRLIALIKRTHEWTDKKKRNELSIFLGRLAKNIGFVSKELPKTLILSTEATPVFELRSNIMKDPKYTDVQNILLNTFHDSHKLWLTWLEEEFKKKLSSSLFRLKWNEHCSAINIWESKCL